MHTLSADIANLPFFWTLLALIPSKLLSTGAQMGTILSIFQRNDYGKTF